jgi:predicted signal transduction protein with EAL and GGDEF domain/CheY-like chemotaxis protein
MSQPAIAVEPDLPSQPEVLLVDDDEVNLLLTSLALRDRGFAIVEATSGEAALERLCTQVPDIIVLDALMPGLDGFETCRRLRRLPGLENAPVLMLTGLDDDASINRAYEAGATDFFVKATQWSLLAGRLRYLLRASRTRLELERNRAKLARAQDLARMGSVEWWREDRGGPARVAAADGGTTGRERHGLNLSPEALRVFGFLPTERIALRTLLRMVPVDDRRPLLRQLHDTLRHVSVLTTDVPVVLLDGRQRVIHAEAEPEYNEHGQWAGYTGVVQDVTDRRVAEDRIRQLANFDSLTGLPNRRQLLWRAERALEQARRLQHQFSLLLIDLDRFKIINDTLGHGAGDELLVEVGRRLRACVRHSDQVMDGAIEFVGVRSHRALEAVGRLGGDEFVALLPEVGDERDAERVAQRILDVLREPIFVGNQECFVTASVGVALFPRDGATVVDLLRNADVAMYSVKQQGKNASAIYNPMLAGRGREKLELETALHKALERNELVLHYQPKVDVRMSRMVGVEALMRWQRGGKLVPPGEFIPLAEDTGLIVPMSEWALREAARQAKAWSQAFGFDDSIAVNMPSRLFERSDLVEHIHGCVGAVGVPHRAIQLEITEDNLMKELQNVIPSLHRLNEIGVEISIDDFGTGYSSLAYLTTLPISEVKVDRSFVRDLGVTPQSTAVVTAIVALARSLGLRVVAEGVETLRQLEVLHRLGCSVMQGFLFSRAVPADELQRWLEQTVLPRKAPWIGVAEPRGAGEEALLSGVPALEAATEAQRLR